MIFNYPVSREHRRHGPRGYAQYESYRPWLRDEFTFRCAYCLKREQWGRVTGEFDLDHFQPQSFQPNLATEYRNMVYSCRRCNAVKADSIVDDPFAVMCDERVNLQSDGSIRGRDPQAARLVLILDLNSPRLVRWRLLWLRILELAAEHDHTLYEQIAGFPAELPRLDRLRPPEGNSRPEGVEESWSARSDRNELPKVY